MYAVAREDRQCEFIWVLHHCSGALIFSGILFRPDFLIKYRAYYVDYLPSTCVGPTTCAHSAKYFTRYFMHEVFVLRLHYYERIPDVEHYCRANVVVNSKYCKTYEIARKSASCRLNLRRERWRRHPTRSGTPTTFPDETLINSTRCERKRLQGIAVEKGN